MSEQRPMQPGNLGRALHEANRAMRVPLQTVLAGAVVAAVSKVVGLDLLHAIFLGLAAVVVVLAVVVVRRGGARAAWLPDNRTETDGSRLEVAALSWSLLGRGGRVSEGALRRLRAVARGRLARNGLDLDEPAHHEAIAALLGPAAWEVLTTTADMPSRRQYEQCVRALERAEPDPTTRRTRP